MPTAQYIVTARHDGKWGWRSFGAYSLTEAIKMATETAIALARSPETKELWSQATITLSTDKRKVLWSAHISALRMLDNNKRRPVRSRR